MERRELALLALRGVDDRLFGPQSRRGDRDPCARARGLGERQPVGRRAPFELLVARRELPRQLLLAVRLDGAARRLERRRQHVVRVGVGRVRRSASRSQ